MSDVLSKEEILALVGTCIHEADVNWREGLELASLDLIVLAVRLEKKFGIQFGLDEISVERFLTLSSIADLVLSKVPRRAAIRT